jgi:hypothetical protein
VTRTPSVPASFKSIIDLVGGRIVDLLTLYCKTSLEAIVEAKPEAADYVATLIRQGQLQDDPVKHRISLVVNPHNPDDLSSRPWHSDRPGDNEDGRGHEPLYEIGGGETWERQFCIDINVYLIKTQETRADARQIGLWVFGRAQQAIRENKALGFTDDFGETALYMLVSNVSPYESGGPPTSLIWRGKLFVVASTRTGETRL